LKQGVMIEMVFTAAEKDWLRNSVYEADFGADFLGKGGTPHSPRVFAQSLDGE
jgi:hypothetical protein